MGSFTLLVPMFVGAITVMLAERIARRSWAYYFWAAAAANALFVVGSLALSIEGLICCILAVPLFSFLRGIGGLLTGALCRQKKWPRESVYGFAVLPLPLGGLEQNLPLPNTIQSVEQSRSVAAPPAEVLWRSFYPQIHSVGRNERRSHVSNGRTVSAVCRNRGARRQSWFAILLWGKTSTSTKWPLPGNPIAKYFGPIDSPKTPFLQMPLMITCESAANTLTSSIPNIRSTRCLVASLRVVMHYRVSTNFNWYVRPIAAFLVTNFERTALAFFACRAESMKHE